MKQVRKIATSTYCQEFPQDILQITKSLKQEPELFQIWKDNYTNQLERNKFIFILKRETEAAFEHLIKLHRTNYKGKVTVFIVPNIYVNVKYKSEDNIRFVNVMLNSWKSYWPVPVECIIGIEIYHLAKLENFNSQTHKIFIFIPVHG